MARQPSVLASRRRGGLSSRPRLPPAVLVDAAQLATASPGTIGTARCQRPRLARNPGSSARAGQRRSACRGQVPRSDDPARKGWALQPGDRPQACTSARTRCSATWARSSPSWASQRAASLTASCPTRAQTASSARQGPAQGVVDSCNAVKVRRGCYFSSRIAWPLSRCSSAITPRNLPVVKSKATTWSWPTQ
jgi:hypothetical protein